MRHSQELDFVFSCNYLFEPVLIMDQKLLVDLMMALGRPLMDLERSRRDLKWPLRDLNRSIIWT